MDIMAKFIMDSRGRAHSEREILTASMTGHNIVAAATHVEDEEEE